MHLHFQSKEKTFPALAGKVFEYGWEITTTNRRLR